MYLQIAQPVEYFPTLLAAVELLAAVNVLVTRQGSGLSEGLPTLVAPVGLRVHVNTPVFCNFVNVFLTLSTPVQAFSNVNLLMGFQAASLSERFVAPFTAIQFLSRVNLFVSVQVTQSCKRSPTLVTAQDPVSGVNPLVVS